MQVYGVVSATPYFRIARWTGTEWVPISEQIFQTNYRLVVHDDGAGPRLYLLGGFSRIGSIFFEGFARWAAGTTWEHPPSNHSSLGTMYDAASFDDGSGPALWAYGNVWVNSVQLNGVAKWDGQTWTGLGGPSTGPQGWARTQIEPFDDGAGPALYVTGQFNNWAGISAVGIVRWNGQAWSALGSGVSPGSGILHMVAGRGPYGRTLFLGGAQLAGGGTVNRVAQYVACPNCYPDCDASGGLNINDFVCFLQKFAASDPHANCDNSTAAPAINVNDFVCFSQKFAAGCP